MGKPKRPKPSRGAHGSKQATNHGLKPRPGDHHVSVIVPGVGEPVVCSGTPDSKAPPFLTSPYAGYAEIASYFDHDLPDYAVDGKIVLATGLPVSGTPTAFSFPSYWSPQLRQWINYDGHNGYDYDIVYQPVLAAAAGTVAYAAWESADPYFGYGQMILIKHAHGYETLYGHLSRILVTVGQKVKAGQKIGISGTTGHSTGPHLHFSVYHNCHVVDPYGWSGGGYDPLVKFSGETSTYLWKDGDAPLILNPLSGWPTYASTLRSHPSPPPPAVTSAVPLMHLLLLQLPQVKPSAAETVLAAFQQQIGDEQQELLPILSALKAQHALTSYTLLQDEGAIKVTGSILPQELLGLPGVASITGARARDVLRAQTGLDEAMASAVEAPLTPSLFPSTYLDAQSLWRLSVSAEENGSYVFGFTQPQAPVRVVVTRASESIGWATTRGNAQRGAFVAVVKDRQGRNVRITAGDVVRISSDGRQTLVDALPLSISADPARNQITGRSPRGAHVMISAHESLNNATYGAATNTPSHGRERTVSLRVGVAGQLAAGDALTSSIVETTGNVLFTRARAPGLDVTVGSELIHGWAAGKARWHVSVYSGHRVQAVGSASPSGNGLLQIFLHSTDHGSHAVTPGDHLRIRTGGAISWMAMPSITGSPRTGNRVFNGVIRPASPLVAQVSNELGHVSTTRDIHVLRSGAYRLKLPRAAGPGAIISLLCRSRSGNIVRMAWTRPGIIIHRHSGLVTGNTAPGQTLVLHAFNERGRLVGSAFAGASPSNGTFAASLLSPQNRPFHFHGHDTVTVSDGQAIARYPIDRLSASLIPGIGLRGWTNVKGRPLAIFYNGSREMWQSRAKVHHTFFQLHLGDVFHFSPTAHVEILVGSPTLGAVEIDLPVFSPASFGASMTRAAGRLGMALLTPR
jgi:murein DD-endopeptidase MepM/ murein hydrolase activator NlpD